MAIDDPPIKDDINLVVSEKDLASSYYKILQGLLSETDVIPVQRGTRTFRTAAIPSAHVRIGLESDVSAEGDLPRLPARNRETLSDSHTFVGPDGVLVELDNAWSDDNMRREPDERTF
jgi:hypothetical protein